MKNLLSGNGRKGQYCQRNQAGGRKPAPGTKLPMSLPSQFKKFDARPALMRGVEPYPEIRKRANWLKPGEGLDVVAPFLPAPLIENLGSEGFKSKVESAPVAEAGSYFIGAKRSNHLWS